MGSMGEIATILLLGGAGVYALYYFGQQQQAAGGGVAPPIDPGVVTPPVDPGAVTPPLPVAPTPPPNLLSGTELTFDDLAWKFYNSGSPDFDEIYLVVPTTPLLNQEIGKGEVFLKYDTSGNWIKVVRQSEAMPDQHIYFFNRENLVVEVYPLNYRLPGRKASVKVQF